MASRINDELSNAFGAIYDVGYFKVNSQQLTPNELANVERLTRDVYGNDEWTFRR